ncbi:glycosyltransferase [Marinomonas sp. C2222]|uniref:Glycosyltransferase n=1 Tax=Marinomonas sargassi TaxID=2984494 RepID=A0ABT2YP02_9GAMM|nr:glycosyltransferase [Marinomonas sargassi]MCV2401633.1 glycosyltransferase [Marinomonas sargassi]
MCKVAVLLAAYNGMEWIEDQVNSILSQKSVSVSLFISVDLSSDGTDVWARELAEKLNNVYLLPYGERFGGAGANFYRLIRDVNFHGFDYISFSDQDDIWLDNKLERACSLLSAKICDVYSSDVLAFWSDGRQQLIKKSYPQKKFDHFFEAAGPGCTYVFNEKSAEALQGFIRDTNDLTKRVALHDWLAYAFCRKHGFKWHIDDQPLMLYRQHDSNQVGINDGFQAYKKRLRLIKNHWYRGQVKSILELVDPYLSKHLDSYFFRCANASLFRRRTRDNVVLFIVLLFGIY